MNEDGIYSFDDSHPIPNLDVCDIEVERKGGGADLIVIIASPMANDMKSRKRLMKKLDNYLGYITSETFATRYGAPSRATTSITVRYHPDTDAGIKELLNECSGWVEDNGATLRLKPLEPKNYPTSQAQ